MSRRTSSGFGDESPILTKSRNYDPQKPVSDLNLSDMYKKLQAHVDGGQKIAEGDLKDYMRHVRNTQGGNYRDYHWLLPKIKTMLKIITTTRPTTGLKTEDCPTPLNLTQGIKGHLSPQPWEEGSETKDLALLTDNDFVTPSHNNECVANNANPSQTYKISQDLFSQDMKDICDMSRQNYDLLKTVAVPTQGSVQHYLNMHEQAGNEINLVYMDNNNRPVGDSDKLTREQIVNIFNDTNYTRNQVTDELKTLSQYANILQEDVQQSAREFRAVSEQDQINRAILRSVCEQITKKELL